MFAKKQYPLQEILFWGFFLVLMGGITMIYKRPDIAMWLGFILAGYSAIGNDSIQTLGTFLSSNEKIKWWILWFFIGGIFLFTMSYGWLTNNGDVAFERLNSIPRPETFHFFHIVAPAILIVLTRYSIPVSTTFLILSVFSSAKTIEAMITKTLYGYMLAFVAALIFWGTLMKCCKKYFQKSLSKKQKKKWRVFQWLSTAFLWSSWLMQDTANIAVFLPRKLEFSQFLIFMSIGFVLIGIILFFRGGKIQSIVREKKDVTEVRAATLIDLMLAFVLIYFKKINHIPMSTTWVFLGLLAGREIVLAHFTNWKNPFKETAYLVAKDILLATIGLVISIALVILTRPEELLPWLKQLLLINGSG